MKRFLVLFLFSCSGLKFELPSESPQPRPSDSTYIRISYRDFSDSILRIQVGPDGLLYVLFSDSLTRLYTSLSYEGFKIEAKANTFYISKDRSIYLASDTILSIYNYNGDLKISKKISNIPAYSICAFDSLRFVLSFYEKSRLVLYHRDSIYPLDTLAYEGNGILNVRKPLNIYCKDSIVFVASSGNNWVEGITLSKNSFVHLGGFSPNPSDSISKFNLPIDVTLDDNYGIFVLELNNRRFQKFNKYGEFIMVSRSPDTTLIPVSIAISRDGKDLFVAYKYRIEKYRKPERP